MPTPPPSFLQAAVIASRSWMGKDITHGIERRQRSGKGQKLRPSACPGFFCSLAVLGNERELKVKDSIKDKLRLRCPNHIDHVALYLHRQFRVFSDIP